MLFRSLAVLAVLLFSIQSAGAVEVALNAQSELRFATVDEGRQVLGSPDAFTAALSPFDRSARMKTGQGVSEAEFLQFASRQVLPWTEADKGKLQQILTRIGGQFAERKLQFPRVVLLVKTSGQEENSAPYHRGNAVVLPLSALQESPQTLNDIIVHELFHVLTSSNPHLREALYRVVGFGSCGTLRLPPEMASRKMTNPDAPATRPCAYVGNGSSAEVVFPVLLSSSAYYDPNGKTDFFGYISLDLLVAEWRDGGWHPKYANGVPVRLGREQFSSFLDQVGRNTNYSADPEEILADSFVMLVGGVRDVPTPWLIAGIDKVLGWSR